jgi:tetratricopeptide (TPR) repeat protein
MAVFYPFPDQISLWQVLGASLLILVISIAVFVMIKRLPYLFTGWMWFGITIAPVIGIIQISIGAPYAMADRYHYLPSIGLAVMMAWGIPTLIKSEEIRKKILFPAGIIFLAIISFLSWNQCGYWKDSITLFSHAVQVTKDNYLAHANLAKALAEKENFNEAIYHYNEAIRIDSFNEILYRIWRGRTYARLDKHQLAIDDFNKAISLYPDYTDTYYDRGTSYGKSGQYQLAISDFNKIISLKPDNIEAYNNRGIVYTQMGIYQKALDDFNEAIRLKSNYADAYYNRAMVYLNQRDNISCCRDALKACELGKCKLLEAANTRGLCR